MAHQPSSSYHPLMNPLPTLGLTGAGLMKPVASVPSLPGAALKGLLMVLSTELFTVSSKAARSETLERLLPEFHQRFSQSPFDELYQFCWRVFTARVAF